jgi:hypothetical protein
VTFRKYPSNLRSLETYIRDYLEPCSHGTLSDVSANLNQSISRHGSRRTPLQWNITISKENPLKFKLSDDCGCKLHVDLFCRIQGEFKPRRFDDVTFKSYSVVFRIWSHDKDISYRNEWDAAELEQKLHKQEWKRVVKRFHLDLRDKNTRLPEPLYHLHFGGIAEDDEYFWVPKTIGEPRLHYFPMDLVLLCEFILMNFFPAESKYLREGPEWKSLVRKSQDLYFKPYLEKLSAYLEDSNDTLLGHLTQTV